MRSFTAEAPCDVLVDSPFPDVVNGNQFLACRGSLHCSLHLCYGRFFSLHHSLPSPDTLIRGVWMSARVYAGQMRNQSASKTAILDAPIMGIYRVF